MDGPNAPADLLHHCTGIFALSRLTILIIAESSAVFSTGFSAVSSTLFFIDLPPPYGSTKTLVQWHMVKDAVENTAEPAVSAVSAVSHKD